MRVPRRVASAIRCWTNRVPWSSVSQPRNRAQATRTTSWLISKVDS
ncbi:hypothetical protein [Nocardioides kongjuensis]